MALFAAVTIFCCFYLFSGHDALVQWYFKLGNCVYHSQSWATDFFTPGIKSDGNMYCIAAILVSLGGLWHVFKRFRSLVDAASPGLPAKFARIDAIPVIICLIAAALLWHRGNTLTWPAYDEVFSAQNAAGINPFQCISYYMLPNNHLLFNLLNGLLFHPAHDKVITGRYLSLLVYSAFIVTLFFWFKQLLQNRWLAVLASITMSLQFIVWGFSFQARGYELYLLAEWGMFISLLSWLQAPRKGWLYVNTVSIVAGYFCMPSFLYFHLAQLLFMLLYMLVFKRKDALFWRYQLQAVLLVFLCYIPALCFSGLDVIVHNRYVAPMDHYKTLGTFCQWFFPFFQANYLDHIFSNVQWKDLSLNMTLGLLPLALLFSRSKTHRLFALFYLCLWLVFFVMVLAMKRPPFERNLIGHYSLSLAGVVLEAWWLAGAIARKVTVVKFTLFSLVVLLLTFHFITTNDTFLKSTPYEYDVNKSYNEINDGLYIIPPGSTVAFTDDAFYCKYIYARKGYKTDKCENYDKDYLINQGDDPIAPALADKYVLFSKAQEYEIYKRK